MAFAQRGLKNILQKYDNDVVILSVLRTPITRSYKGGLRNAYPEQMLAAVVRGILDRNPKLDPAAVSDIAVGTVLSELGGSKAGRMAMNHTGFPPTTSFYTVNRACASSLQSFTTVASSIALQQFDVGIAGGMESMTLNYGSKAIPTNYWPELKDSPVKNAKDCVMSMGLTSENVAERYNVSREDQDAFGAESHKRASQAQRNGFFDDEIVPVKVSNPIGQGEGAEKPDVQTAETVLVDKDDGIRHNVSVEKMGTLKPVFKPDGRSTAGNSSQVSDGASAALLMRRSTATSLGLSDSIIGKWVSSVCVGVAPDEMGIGPTVAIPALLSKTDISKEDVGVWEINEAFASQALYCIRKLGLDGKMDKINPNGGGIALGHPLGATGTRQLATLMHEMGRQGEQVGVVILLSNRRVNTFPPSSSILFNEREETNLKDLETTDHAGFNCHGQALPNFRNPSAGVIMG
ncbi:MAG: hypothetical protein M1834_001311 [Cirrosporium novae-zelandiae]|nr:MAG: hypothetical protein M1834_001311 [Cirrosporium novae-zelandiae]